LDSRGERQSLIREFGLRDFSSVGKMQRHGILLGLEEACTRPYRPLLAAMAAYLTAHGMGTRTHVSIDNESGEVEGFVQVRLRRNRPEADAVFLAPALHKADDLSLVWVRLLKHVRHDVAGRGVQRIFARLPEGGPEMEPFRQAGFGVYTREDIFRITPDEMKERLSTQPLPALRPESALDSWGLQQLYVAIAPRLVQQAENLVDSGGNSQVLDWAGFGRREGYILEDQKETIGYVQLWQGQMGHWLKIFLHPRAYDQVDRLLDHSLACWQRYPRRPLYCEVPEYQGGLRGPLEARGFQLFATQAIVVKHTTVRAQEPMRRLVPALEKRIEPTTPMVNSKCSTPSSVVESR
jgi:hypothetical protein